MISVASLHKEATLFFCKTVYSKYLNKFKQHTIYICMYILCKENRIYIRGEFTRKKCKTAILLYCFHTAGVLDIFVSSTFLALEHHFIENLKLILKENQIMK